MDNCKRSHNKLIFFITPFLSANILDAFVHILSNTLIEGSTVNIFWNFFGNFFQRHLSRGPFRTILAKIRTEYFFQNFFGNFFQRHLSRGPFRTILAKIRTEYFFVIFSYFFDEFLSTPSVGFFFSFFQMNNICTTFP